MNKNINSLTGIEFEKLCQTLLTKVGFDVETTKQSGDGGIDLIACNRQDFLSGKYIVQCKRYVGSVGEPVVRDLYGVVTAERANKGILVTTGHFTISAVRFADNKNIELIDGDKLAQLLSKYELNFDNRPIQYDHFTQYDCFDKRKYDFYKNMIAQNQCSLEMAEDFLLRFMYDYMSMVGKSKKINAMLHAEFSKEYLSLFNWYVEKYYKSKKAKNIISVYSDSYKGLAQLLNFDLLDYIQNRYKRLKDSCIIRLRYKSNTYLLSALHYNLHEEKSAIMENLMNSKVISFPEQDYNFYELMNILSLFSYFKVENGVDLINRLLYGNYPEFKEWIETRKVYQDAIKNVKIYSGEERPLNLTSYFDTYSNEYKEKIQNELSVVIDLLYTLL